MGIKEDIERLRQWEDDDGELAELADSLEKQFDASPLRSENKELKRKAQEALEKAERLNAYALQAAFEKIGLKVKPDALRLPDDLDPTDTPALTAWATEKGFIEAKPETPIEEQKAHEQMSQAVAGGEVTGKEDWTDLISKANTQEEVLELVRKAGGAVRSDFT